MEGRVPSQKWIAAAYGDAVAFRSFTGPHVLSSGCWVHDGFQLFWSVRCFDADDRQPLTAPTTRIWCCTPIWNVDLSSGSESQKETKKQSTNREDCRTDTPLSLINLVREGFQHFLHHFLHFISGTSFSPGPVVQGGWSNLISQSSERHYRWRIFHQHHVQVSAELLDVSPRLFCGTDDATRGLDFEAVFGLS